MVRIFFIDKPDMNVNQVKIMDLILIQFYRTQLNINILKVFAQNKTDQAIFSIYIFYYFYHQYNFSITKINTNSIIQSSNKDNYVIYLFTQQLIRSKQVGNNLLLTRYILIFIVQKKIQIEKKVINFSKIDFHILIYYMNSIIKKKQRSVPSFLKKTYQILEDLENEKIVRWANDGKGFRVLDQQGFSKIILPKYFKHSNYSSFVRQLNMYNFHKMRDCTTESFFYHQYFDKNNSQAIYQIKRKPERKKKKQDQQNQLQRSQVQEQSLKSKLSKKKKKNLFIQSFGNNLYLLENQQQQILNQNSLKVQNQINQPCSYFSKLNDRYVIMQYQQIQQQDNISIENCIKQKNNQRVPFLLGTKQLICPSTTNFYNSIYNNSGSIFSIGSLIR